MRLALSRITQWTITFTLLKLISPMRMRVCSYYNRRLRLYERSRSRTSYSCCAFQTDQSLRNYRANQKTIVTTSRSPHISTWPHHATRRKMNTLSYADVMNMNDGHLDPFSIRNGTIPMPKALSPSSAAEFKACPQSYLFQYLYSIKQPPNLALAKGSMCHSALEEIFDLEPRERSLEHLQNLFRKNWSEVRLSEAYGPLFEKRPGAESDDGTTYERDIEAERKWGNEALRLLSNYYELEDPRIIPRPNPLEREIWVTAHLSLDPSKGATAEIDSAEDYDSHNDTDEEEGTFFVRGIVDRLDYVATPHYPHKQNHDDESAQGGCIRIVDYKTGKAPHFKYSPATNQRIAEDNMWQLKIYALLLREMISNGKAYSKSGHLQNISGKDIRLLRLMYLTSVDGEARFLDMDLGQTHNERNAVLQEIHQDLSCIWKAVKELVDMQDPSNFKHCNREWCVCHKLRPKFVPGSLFHENG